MNEAVSKISETKEDPEMVKSVGEDGFTEGKGDDKETLYQIFNREHPSFRVDKGHLAPNADFNTDRRRVSQFRILVLI